MGAGVLAGTSSVAVTDTVGVGVAVGMGDGVKVGANVAGSTVGGTGVIAATVAVGGRGVGCAVGDGGVARSVAGAVAVIAGAQADSTTLNINGRTCLKVVIESAHSAFAG